MTVNSEWARTGGRRGVESMLNAGWSDAKLSVNRKKIMERKNVPALGMENWDGKLLEGNLLRAHRL